jgi:hypothetical protein
MSIPEGFHMTTKDGVGQQTSANTTETAVRPGKGPQGTLKNQKDPGKPNPNPHREHQDRHGSGEGATGMQPGAGHPRSR